MQVYIGKLCTHSGLRARRALTVVVVIGGLLVGTAAVATAAQLTLAWGDASTNEDGFKIERKTGTAGTYQQLATVAANITGYVDGTVTAGTTYCYRVLSYNSAADSLYSNEACGTPVSATLYTVTVTKAGTGSGTVASSPSGVNCGSTCVAEVASGASLALSATPAAGSIFTGWNGACTGTGPCALVVTGSKTLTATFGQAYPSGTWSGCGVDRCLPNRLAGDISLVGDWNGSRSPKDGFFRPSDGTFYLDYNGNGTWDGCGVDRCLRIGLNGDVPLVGDWNGTGTTKVGTFRPAEGTFYLDYNGNGVWDGCGADRCIHIGLKGDVPLVGDWNGTGTTKVGTFRPADRTSYLDYNGNGVWDGCGVDRCL